MLAKNIYKNDIYREKIDNQITLPPMLEKGDFCTATCNLVRVQVFGKSVLAAYNVWKLTLVYWKYIVKVQTKWGFRLNHKFYSNALQQTHYPEGWSEQYLGRNP